MLDQDKRELELSASNVSLSLIQTHDCLIFTFELELEVPAKQETKLISCHIRVEYYTRPFFSS